MTDKELYDLKRIDVLTRLGKFIQLELIVGTASVWSVYYILRSLLAGEKPGVSKRMWLIKVLIKRDPQLLADLIPYLSSDSEKVLPEEYRKPTSKKESW